MQHIVYATLRIFYSSKQYHITLLCVGLCNMCLQWKGDNKTLCEVTREKMLSSAILTSKSFIITNTTQLGCVSIHNPLTFFLVFKSLTLPDPSNTHRPSLFSCCISSLSPWGNECWWMWKTLPIWILAHKKSIHPNAFSPPHSYK